MVPKSTTDSPTIVTPPPFGMVMVSSFNEKYNTNYDAIEIISSSIHHCPQCSGGLVYRDHKLRRTKNLAGGETLYLLRRFRCTTCGKYHTEIPDSIQPYKHYDSETIQSVLDEEECTDACIADASTIRRWKEEFQFAAHNIEQQIAAVYAKESGNHVPLRTPGEILKHIRTLHNRWLAFVMTLLINTGYKLCTRFAFCPESTSVRLKAGRENISTEEIRDVKTIKNSS